MKNGFDRLKGVAAASAMGLGLVGAGSARAVSYSLGNSVSVVLAATFSSNGLVAQFLGVGGASGTLSINNLSISTIPYSGSAFRGAFDGVLGVTVGGIGFENPDAVIDFTNLVLNSDVHVDIVAGVNAQVQFAFDGSHGGTSMGLVRALYSFTNTTDASITTTVTVDGDLGSDAETTIQATSSGNRIAENADMWTLSSDEAFGVDPTLSEFEPAGAGDPALVITRYGSGATVVPTQNITIADGNGIFANDYDLTIPAGETQRVLVFIEAHSTNAGAVGVVADFQSLAAAYNAGLLTGMNNTQIDEIVNYYSDNTSDDDVDYVSNALDNCVDMANLDQADADGDGVGDVCDAYPDDYNRSQAVPSSDSGSTGLPALFVLLGVPALMRLFRKK